MYDPKTFSGLPSQQQADYTFDIASQLESIVNQILPSTNISTYAYPDYDHAGNRRQIDITYESTGPVSTIYGYNDITYPTSMFDSE